MTDATQTALQQVTGKLKRAKRKAPKALGTQGVFGAFWFRTDAKNAAHQAVRMSPPPRRLKMTEPSSASSLSVTTWPSIQN